MMLLSLRSHVTAGVAIAGAGLIAVTPVTPSLPVVRVPAVQLTADAGALGSLEDVIGQLASPLTSGGGLLGDIPGLGSVGSLDPGNLLGDVTGLLNPAASLSEAGIQTALINAIMAAETALSNGSVALGTALSAPFENIGTAISNLATTISDMGGASVFIGGIVDNFATPFSTLGELINLGLADIVPGDIIAPLFDIPTQLVLFGSNVFDALTGMPVGSDLAAGVSGLSALSDVSALSGVSAQAIESFIQTLLIDFGGSGGTLDTIGSAFFESFFQTVVPAPFDLVQSSLNAIGSFIGDISPVFGPIDTIFGDMGSLTSITGELLSLAPAIPYAAFVEPLLFGNFQELVDLGSFLISGGSSSAADAAGLPDLGAGLVADLSALYPGLAADFSGIAADLGSFVPF